jgi:hypothetical protein
VIAHDQNYIFEIVLGSCTCAICNVWLSFFISVIFKYVSVDYVVIFTINMIMALLLYCYYLGVFSLFLCLMIKKLSKH